MKKTVRHARRYIEIISTLKKHGFGELITKSGIEKALGFGKTGVVPEIDPSAYTQNTWVRIRRIFEDLGPAYIKFAQLLCFRGDLIPLELVEELEELNDNLPPFPTQEAKALIARELETPIDEVFASFVDEPIAAGSVAQVHKAVLHTGEIVAVKVQRPDVLQKVRTDLEIMKHVSEIACRKIPELQVYNLRLILDEFSKAIELELDFLHEAANMEHFAHCYGDMEELHVPACYRRYCSRRVLTMEFIDGIKISETEEIRAAGYDMKMLARRGVDIILRHLFAEGFFHADPHAGNFVVMPDQRLCLLDYGMMGSLSPPTRRLLTSMLIGAVLHDSEYISRHVLRICTVSGEVDRNELETDISVILDGLFAAKPEQVDMEQVVKNCIRLFPKHGLLLPADLYLLGRSMILLQNNGGNRLDPEFSIASHLMPFIKENIRSRFKVTSLMKDSAIAVEELAQFAKTMPSEVSDLMDRAKQGKLGMRLTLEGVDEARRSLEQSANRLALALIIAATLIGSSMLLGPDCQRTIFGFPSFCLVGYLIAGVFGLLLVYLIFKSKR